MKAPVRNLGVKQDVYMIVNKEQIHDILSRIICESFSTIINRSIIEAHDDIAEFIEDIERDQIDDKISGVLHSNPVDHLIKHGKQLITKKLCQNFHKHQYKKNMQKKFYLHKHKKMI